MEIIRTLPIKKTINSVIIVEIIYIHRANLCFVVVVSIISLYYYFSVLFIFNTLLENLLRIDRFSFQ